MFTQGHWSLFTGMLSAVSQYNRTIGNTRDNLYPKHHMRDSDISVNHAHNYNNILSEFLIEVKLTEEQDEIAQIVAGSAGVQTGPTAYDEYVNASKGKVQNGKSNGTDAKRTLKNWRQPCSGFWGPGRRSLGHNHSKYNPRRQPGRRAICGPTKHYASQCRKPGKPKTKQHKYVELETNGVHKPVHGMISGERI